MTKLALALISIDFEARKVSVVERNAEGEVTLNGEQLAVSQNGTVVHAESGQQATVEPVRINPATGAPMKPVEGYVSGEAMLLAGVYNRKQEQPNPTQSTGDVQDPVRVPFFADKHYGNYTLDGGQKYVFDRGGATGSIAVHFVVPTDAKIGDHVQIKLAGVTSGEVTGGAAASFGDYDAPNQPPFMEGQLNSFGIARDVDGGAVRAGGFVNVMLNIQGGDDSFFLEARILPKQA